MFSLFFFLNPLSFWWTAVGFDSNNEFSLTSPISNTSDSQTYTDFSDFVDHTGTATEGYVRKWYGQESSGGTGSGLDAEQSTAPSQLKIYDGSGIIEKNGKPILETTENVTRFEQQNITQNAPWTVMGVTDPQYDYNRVAMYIYLSTIGR